jgi:hypothetical protein
VNILCFNWSNTILAMPRQQLLEMANGNGDGDGQWRWQLQWLMVMETAMANSKGDNNATAMADGNATVMVVATVDGDCNGNGRWRWQWATATAMVLELATTIEMAMSIAMAMATARVTMTKAGLPLHVPAMCSAMAGATPCLHPHGHKESAFTSAASWGDTAKSVCSPSRGRVPDSSPWILFLFIIYNYCSVY